MSKENIKLHHLEVIQSLRQNQALSLGLELEKRAFQHPEKTALIYQDQITTYNQFNRMANRYAHLFLQLGFKKGDVVALLMDNRPEYLAAVSGLSKIGVIVALINTVIRGERLSYAINISEPRAVIVGSELLEVFQSITNGLRLKSPGKILVETSQLETSIPAHMEALNPLLSSSPDYNPENTKDICSNDILLHMETAGSSGTRKAVEIAQKRWLIMGHQFALAGNMTGNEIQYMCLPLYLNMGFNVSFSSLLISGGTMVLKPKFSVSNFWADIRKYQVTHFMAVGEMLRYICEQAPRPDDLDNPLEYVLGAGTRGDLTIPLHTRFGIKNVLEVYGTTEGVGTFINQDEMSGMCGNLNFENIRQGEVVRFDLENNQIVYDEAGRAIKCLPGQTGLLVAEINNLNCFPGYVNQPQESEARILRNVFREGDQYFNTGDMVQLHENEYISFVDRLGDTYRWKSKTVSANQVTDVLNKFFGGIEEAYVYGVKIPGMEGRCGMAALEIMEDVPLDWKMFVDHINRRMPDHARPVFIRICDKVDVNVFKTLKRQMQKEGFDPQVINDPLYYYDVEKNCYTPLTVEKYNDILTHKIRI